MKVLKKIRSNSIISYEEKCLLEKESKELSIDKRRKLKTEFVFSRRYSECSAKTLW